MRRYDPIHRFPIGGSTLGEMQACSEGDWVAYHDALRCQKHIQKQLKDCRAALKLIIESPTRCAHAIAEMVLLNSKPSGLEEEVVTPKDTPQ